MRNSQCAIKNGGGGEREYRAESIERRGGFAEAVLRGCFFNSQFAIRNSQLRTAKIELQREKRKDRRADGKRQKGSTKWGSWLRRSRRLKGCPSQGKTSCINSRIYATFFISDRILVGYSAEAAPSPTAGAAVPRPEDACILPAEFIPLAPWGRLCGSSPSENACILP